MGEIDMIAWLSLTLSYTQKSLDRSFIIMQEFPNSRGAAMPGGVTVAASLSAAAPFAKVTQASTCITLLCNISLLSGC